jgi:hypothetical protein
VPVIQNDRTYGLYDLVENKFYINVGTGVFTGKSFSPEFKAIYLGSDKEELAPFSVTNTGKLTATSGTIGGFNITTDNITSADNNLQLNKNGGIVATAGAIGGFTISEESIEKKHLNSSGTVIGQVCLDENKISFGTNDNCYIDAGGGLVTNTASVGN